MTVKKTEWEVSELLQGEINLRRTENLLEFPLQIDFSNQGRKN